MPPMYSSEWFQTYAATVPATITESDLRGITAVLPLEPYARILDVGCGIGRISGPLSQRGYSVTGVDVSGEALLAASRRAPGPRYVGLDQRHIGRMRWVFDGVLFLWNSLGFVDRNADVETLAGVAAALRPGGRVVFDLYHPDWLEQHQRSGGPDDRGAVSIRRWMRDGRCFHEIRYANGRVDDIQFNVYAPEEIRALCGRAGLEPGVDMVWWNADTRPSPDAPRYQLVAARPK
jgi:SAM-dependent methyltransferase